MLTMPVRQGLLRPRGPNFYTLLSSPETLKITNLKNLDSIVFYTESALRVDSKDSEWFFFKEIFLKKLHLFLDLIILFRILAPKTLPQPCDEGYESFCLSNFLPSFFRLSVSISRIRFCFIVRTLVE